MWFQLGMETNSEICCVGVLYLYISVYQIIRRTDYQTTKAILQKIKDVIFLNVRVL